VAVIDTSMWGEKGKSKYLVYDGWDTERIVAHYDAIKNAELKTKFNSDKNGHGSHVTSILMSSRYKDSEYNGVAPDARLIAIQAFDDEGAGTYSNVIRGLDWVLKNRDKYGIRVLNLSFSTKPRSWYWDDPLNQAVMAAWQSGIVVVASAGNKGPDPMTIGVPGNVPYVITVGAMTDSVTPIDWTDDALASFSAATESAGGRAESSSASRSLSTNAPPTSSETIAAAAAASHNRRESPSGSSGIAGFAFASRPA